MAYFCFYFGHALFSSVRASSEEQNHGLVEAIMVPSPPLHNLEIVGVLFVALLGSTFFRLFRMFICILDSGIVFQVSVFYCRLLHVFI